MTALLEVQDLHKHFGGVQAVTACSFTAAEGQITGLIGPNGAGKSTAIDLISGFKVPDTGTVRFEGKEVPVSYTHLNRCRISAVPITALTTVGNIRRAVRGSVMHTMATTWTTLSAPASWNSARPALTIRTMATAPSGTIGGSRRIRLIEAVTMLVVRA